MNLDFFLLCVKQKVIHLPGITAKLVALIIIILYL